MNSISNKEEAVKPAYESMTCLVIEVDTQGVICASNDDEGDHFGRLDPYNGSEL